MKAHLVLIQKRSLSVCEEFCLLFSSVVENQNLERRKHVISISRAVKTRRHVMVRSTDGSVQCPDTLLGSTGEQKAEI